MNRHIRSLLPILVFPLFSVAVHAQPCDMTGTYSVGPGGNFTTLTAATAALRTNGVGGPVLLELQSNYTASGETYPLLFGDIPCISATNSLTVRPAAAVVSITLNAFTIVINMSNARYVTIDGRPGGTGINSALSINNQGGGVGTIIFRNDASYNTLKYLNIKGISSSATSGVIDFGPSTGTITNGNIDNEISNCSIGDGAATPTNCIYSIGAPGKKNRNNKISNCSIYNFYEPDAQAVPASGIMLNSYNSDWEINGNSFFQTAPRTGLQSDLVAININDINSSGFIVVNNFIGGTAAACGGTALIHKRADFTGIRVSAGTGNTSIIENNTIANIAWEPVFGEDMFNAIELKRGRIDCGGSLGNTIGSQTQRGSIVVSTSNLANVTLAGIAVLPGNNQTSSDSFLLRNNKIGGLRNSSANISTTLSRSFCAINVDTLSAAYLKITDNIIGGSVPGSIESDFLTEYARAIVVRIKNVQFDNPGYPAVFTISGNTIRNFSGSFRLIDILGGIGKIENNIIRSSIADGTGQGSPYITAIALNSCLPGTSIDGNNIYNFTLKGSNYGSASGIVCEQSSGIVIKKNNIHSFQSVPVGSMYTGINIDYTSMFHHSDYKVINNMIRLGVDTLGNQILQNGSYTGISAPIDSTVIAHNSVYIGGSNSQEQESNALVITAKRTGPGRIINNIFQNNRPGASSIFKGALIKFASGINPASGNVVDNNIYYTTAPSCFLGKFNNAGYSGITAWRTASLCDSASVFSNPNYINPNGDVNMQNLHLANPNPAEGQGVIESSVTDDFDGQQRSNFTPVDIGADAGDFSLVSPVICAGGSTTMYSDIIGTTYQWQLNTGSGYANISNNSNYNGTNTPVLILTGLPSSWYGYLYRCVVNGNNNSSAIELRFSNTWTGAINTEWENPGNWSCGTVPDMNTDVIINSGTVVLSTNTTVRTLTLAPGVIFTIAPGVNLTITH